MKNVFIQHMDEMRHAEITKPVYTEVQNIPLGVVNCGNATIFETYTSIKWKHRGFVFMFVCDGEGEVIIEDKLYILKTGDVFCYRTMNTGATITPRTKTFTYKWIDIYGTASSFYYNLINESTFPSPGIHTLSLDLIHYHFERIVKNLMSDSKYACYKNASILSELLTALVSEQESAENYGNDKYARSFSELFEFVEKNYYNNITIEQMAQVFGMSKFYFIRLFKESVGIPPMRYVRNYRIGKSTELLMQSDRSIEEIGEIVGYKTTSQFIGNFRDVMKTTPLQYRKTHKHMHYMP